ncbi:MAG: TolC family protein [Verrucomicrobiae bacterium]|nr:TolC family protein [Verrucomicrobiae bacterium]
MKLYKHAFLRWLLVIPACLVVLYGADAQTAPRDPLSPSLAPFLATDLQSYLEQAQAANPQLKAFEARYQAASRRIPQLSALPDPMLQVTHFVESVQTRTGPQENLFMLSQRIPWFGKLSSRETMATAEAEALWFAYQNQQLSLARTVALQFYEYAYTGIAEQLTEENLALLTDLEPVVEEKVRAGGDLNALLRLKVEIGKMTDKVQSLKQKRRVQSAQLCELLALPADTVLPWPKWREPTIETVDGAVLIPAIETNHPELQMLERQLTSAEARQEIARLESSPDFTLGVNYIQVGNPVVNPTTPHAGKDPWSVSFAINLPIWGKKNSAAKEEALLGKRAIESEYQNRLNALKAQLTASIAQLDDANRRHTLYGDQLLTLAEQAVENSQSSYEGGRTGILEVIDSERSLLELQLLHRRAEADALQQRITIQALANQPLNGTFNPTENDE